MFENYFLELFSVFQNKNTENMFNDKKLFSIFYS